MVLSDFSPEVGAIADIEAFGVVLARPEGLAQLVTRHPVGVAAHLLPVDRLPAVLVPSAPGTVVCAPLPAHEEAAHPAVQRLVGYGIDCLLVTALPDGAGLFWAGKKGTSKFDETQVAAFEQLAARVAASLHAPEPREVRLGRLARLEAVEQVLTLVAGALDVRDVFHRLSEVARSVLPHDAATIQILSADWSTARVYALDGIPRESVPQEFRTHYASLFNEHFEFSLHDDLLANPAERDRPAAKAGMRSSLRLPLRFNGRLGGALEFSSSKIANYRETDVDVGRRIADYVTLAIAHQQMADEGRSAAALRERADNLQMLEDLIATLSGVLGVREVLDRISQIAGKILPHDAMAVTTVLERENVIRVHALSGFTDFPPFFEAPLPEPELLSEPWDHRIIDDLTADPRYSGSPTVVAGMRSVLGLPVRFEGRLHYGVNFYSRSTSAFTPDDVLIGKRIADHVALALSHQRLAEQSRSNAELKARTASLELLDELLATLTDAGRVSDLFERISAVAKNVIPHDAMALPVMLPDGVNARRYASAGLDVSALPDVIPVPPGFRRDDDWEYDLIEDTSQRPEEYNQHVATMGFRSVLRVPIRLDGRFAAGLAFMAHAPGVYKTADVLTARRIGERFALSLMRERGVEAWKRAGEAVDARRPPRAARARALRRARCAHRLPPRGRRVGGVARGADAGDAGRGDRDHRAAARRVGNRQGGGCAVPAPRVAARQRAVRRAQLRGAAGAPARGGAVRLRARRVHGRDAEQAGAARTGRRRHAVPRRSRRDGAVSAGEIPARAAGEGIPAPWRHARPPHRRARRRRNQPRSAAGDAAGSVPRGSVLPAERLRDPPAAAARSARRRRVACRRVSRRVRPQPRAAAGRHLARRAQEADGVSLAGQRPRAAQHPRARRDSVRRRPDHGGTSRARQPRACIGARRGADGGRRTDRSGPATDRIRRRSATSRRWSGR